MNKTLTPAQRAAFFRALQAASVEDRKSVV